MFPVVYTPPMDHLTSITRVMSHASPLQHLQPSSSNRSVTFPSCASDVTKHLVQQVCVSRVCRMSNYSNKHAALGGKLWQSAVARQTLFCLFSKLETSKRDVKWLHAVSGEWFEEIQKKKFKDDPDVRSLVRPPLTFRLKKKTPKGGESEREGGWVLLQ